MVEFTGVTRRYAPDRGVEDVSLTVRAGDCIGLLGRNGSGKSTLTRLLLGIERTDRGMVRVLGRNPAVRNRAHLASTGACLDTTPHWDSLSGRANARFIANTCGVPREKIESRIDELFGLAGLDTQANDAVRTWSFGMRRKLGLVGALIHNPALLVLDEPTSGVDPQFLLQLADLIRGRSATGRTTWIAGNDPGWIAAFATHVAFIDRGSIVAAGAVDELMAMVAATQEILIELAGPVAIPRMAGDDILSYGQEGESLRIVATDDPAAITAVMQWIVRHGGSPKRIEIRKPSLRDVYLMKTGRSLDT